jgi:hypothetical protein
MKNIIVLSDGTTISSGSSGAAILSFKLTQCVNSKQELTLGSACAAMLEMKLLLPEQMRIQAGQELTLLKQDDWGVQHQVGIFVTQKPEQTGSYGCKVTAFDRMVYTDRDLTDWLASLTGWPYTQQELAQMVCSVCGVELAGEPLPNGDLPVQAFQAADITGRELLQWIGEANGRFCRADPQGRLEFAWYAPAGRLTLGPEFVSRMGSHYQQGQLTLELTGTATQTGVCLDGPYLSVRDDGAGHVTLLGQEQQYYFMGGLQKSDYTVCPIERVQIRANAQDVGTLWPQTETRANTYIIEGNPLLTAQSSQSLLQLAQDLYEQLHALSYTPCKISMPAGVELQPGQWLSVTDSRGGQFQMLIMQKEQSGQKDTLECTGSEHRQTAAAVNSRHLKALSGKVLELRAEVDGLKVKNADAEGRAAQLELDLEGLRGQVSRQEAGVTLLTQLQQSAQELKLQVESLEQNAGKVITSTGYSFTDAGLRISKSGQEMESLVDHTGLYVNRNGQMILQAGSRGVAAVDVTVNNYLVVGQHARFEDYDGGTACFYI